MAGTCFQTSLNIGLTCLEPLTSPATIQSRHRGLKPSGTIDTNPSIGADLTPSRSVE